MEDPLIEKNNGLNYMSADDGGSFDIKENEEEEGSDAFTTVPLAQYKPHDDHLGLRRRRRTNVWYSDDDMPNLKPLFLKGVNLKYLAEISSYDHHQTKKEEPQLLEKPYYDHISHFRLMLPLTKTPSMKFDLISKCLNQVSLGGPMIDQIYQSTLKLMVPVSLLLNKPFDDHFRLRQRRIKLSFRGGTLDLTSWFRDDDYLLHRLIDLATGVDVVSQMISPPTVIAAPGTDCNPTLATASVVTARPRHTETSIYDFLDSLIDSGGVDVDSQMISPPTVIGAAENMQISPLLDPSHCIDNMPGGNSSDERKGWSQMDFEWIFVITNIVLECMSAIFTQLSSKQKPQYALFGMLLSYLALLTCIIELIYEGHQQIPIQREVFNNRPQRGKSFATLNIIVALACALGECVVTTINYRFEGLIKLTVLPIILANGVFFSKIFKYRERERERFKKSFLKIQ